MSYARTLSEILQTYALEIPQTYVRALLEIWQNHAIDNNYEIWQNYEGAKSETCQQYVRIICI